MHNLDVDPQWYDLLPPAEQQKLGQALHRLVGGERLVDYITRVFPEEPPQPHVMPILDVIEYARVKPIRICIDMGPGTGKTVTLMRSVAWWLSPEHSPADLCAYVTFSDGKAREKSRIAKEALERGGGLLHDSKTSDSEWLTPQGGGLVAKGSRGGLTGSRVPGLLIYDDPYKDMQEARSQAINSMVIERFKGVAVTRLQGGSIIVLHTRWAMDDLIGYIQKHLKWDHIHIPSICDSVDPTTGRDAIGRVIGEAAWPAKYPNIDVCSGICSHDGHLVEIRKTLGEHIFNAMHQGRPRPEGQAIFHEPARYEKKDFTWTGKRGVIAIDPAATAKTSADWSVLLVCAIEGYGTDSRMWIIDRVRVQVEIPELIKTARTLQKRYRLMIACEAVAGFKAVPQTLRAMDPTLRVIEIQAGRDKFTRALGVASAWNDGRVLVPQSEDAPWADDMIEEFTRFTGNNDAHDDQVDAGAHAWNTLYRLRPKVVESDYAAGGM